VIDIIFQQKGLDMRKGNIMLIAPRDECNPGKLELSRASNQRSRADPVEQFSLNYKAVDVARLLSGVAVAGGAPSQRLMSKRGNAVADPQSNILFVNDIGSRRSASSSGPSIRAPVRSYRGTGREAQDQFNRDSVRLNGLSAAHAAWR
jgi:type IV pilus assembly protein PilQ